MYVLVVDVFGYYVERCVGLEVDFFYVVVVDEVVDVG